MWSVQMPVYLWDDNSHPSPCTKLTRWLRFWACGGGGWSLPHSPLAEYRKPHHINIQLLGGGTIGSCPDVRSETTPVLLAVMIACHYMHTLSHCRNRWKITIQVFWRNKIGSAPFGLLHRARKTWGMLSLRCATAAMYQNKLIITDINVPFFSMHDINQWHTNKWMYIT